MKFELDFTPLKIDTEILKRLDLPKFVDQEMQNVRARLVADTVAGQKADGGGLKEYSASYKKAIDSGRVAGKAPGNHKVNLTATGVLLRSLKIVKEKADALGVGVRLFFDGTHPPARHVSSEGARRKRNKAIRAGSLAGKIQGAKSTKIRKVKIKGVTTYGLAAPSRNPKASQILKSISLEPKRISERKARDAATKARRDALRKSGGGDVPNAAIAQSQYDMGRTGWMAFSRKKDVERIQQALRLRIDQIKSQLFKKQG